VRRLFRARRTPRLLSLVGPRDDRLRVLVSIITLFVGLSGCAGRQLTLPTDAGSPLADLDAIHGPASKACREVRTFTAELRLSGRAGSQPLKGTVHAGFKRPRSMRLEMVSGFGAPIFIMTAGENGATLLFPREQRVVRDATPEAILGALTGVGLAPADLLAILTGCVVPEPHPIAGRLHGNGWASIDMSGEAVMYLQPDQQAWRVRAARRGAWRIEYPAWARGSAFPSRVRLSTSMPPGVDLSAIVSQVETNVDLEDAVFTARVRDEKPMTLDELKASGPLRQE
jgi:outer membrane biogenesis lipoprotein LolB